MVVLWVRGSEVLAAKMSPKSTVMGSILQRAHRFKASFGYKSYAPVTRRARLRVAARIAAESSRASLDEGELAKAQVLAETSLDAITSRWSRWRPSLLGWRPSLLGTKNKEKEERYR